MFDLETVKDALHAVVVEKGEDFVYQGACTYVAPENAWDQDAEFAPSCIVGQVLAKIDPEYLANIQQREWEYVKTYKEWVPSSLQVGALGGVEERFDNTTMQFLSAAQIEQDAGVSYGIVEARALKKLEKVS